MTVLVGFLIFLYGIIFILFILVLLNKLSEIHVLVNSKMTAALEQIERLENALANERREHK